MKSAVCGYAAWRLACVALLAFCAIATRAQEVAPQTQPPVIRVNVDRVNVGVIVTGEHGDFVEGLHREDFHIFDNGVEQPITGFLPIADPAQVLLLVESGPAVFFLGKSHFLAAEALLTRLSPEDRVAIASYSRDPQLLLGFTSDKKAARYALEELNFGIGFADLNLSASLAAVLDGLTALPGKKSLVVLSTGIDTSPVEKLPLIEQKLKTADVRILAVSLSGDFRKPVKHKKLTAKENRDRAMLEEGFAAADQSLRELAAATGGRAYFPKNEKEFELAYAEIAQLVRHEYSLAFTPPARDGQVHTIEVKVNGFARRVDSRQAYLAPPPG